MSDRVREVIQKARKRKGRPYDGWLTENEKVNLPIKTYNNPAIWSCLLGRPCNYKDTGYCYAAQDSNWSMPDAIWSNVANMWAAAFCKGWEKAIIRKMGYHKRGKKPERILRWHSGGDFFGPRDIAALQSKHGHYIDEGDESRWPYAGFDLGPLKFGSYLERVEAVVRATPDVPHYGYTKRSDLVGTNPVLTGKIKNCRIRFSVDAPVSAEHAKRQVEEIELARGHGLSLAPCIWMSTDRILDYGVDCEFLYALDNSEKAFGVSFQSAYTCPCSLDATKRHAIARDVMAREYGQRGVRLVGTTYEPLEEGTEFFAAKQNHTRPLGFLSKDLYAPWGKDVANIGTGEKDWICSVCNLGCRNDAKKDERTLCYALGGPKSENPRDVIFVIHGSPQGTSRAQYYVENAMRAWAVLTNPAMRPAKYRDAVYNGMTMEEFGDVYRPLKKHYKKRLFVTQKRHPMLSVSNPAEDAWLWSPEALVAQWDQNLGGPMMADAPEEYLVEAVIDAVEAQEERSRAPRTFDMAANPRDYSPYAPPLVDPWQERRLMRNPELVVFSNPTRQWPVSGVEHPERFIPGRCWADEASAISAISPEEMFAENPVTKVDGEPRRLANWHTITYVDSKELRRKSGPYGGIKKQRVYRKKSGKAKWVEMWGTHTIRSDYYQVRALTKKKGWVTQGARLSVETYAPKAVLVNAAKWEILTGTYKKKKNRLVPIGVSFAKGCGRAPKDIRKTMERYKTALIDVYGTKAAIREIRPVCFPNGIDDIYGAAERKVVAMPERRRTPARKAANPCACRATRKNPRGSRSLLKPGKYTIRELRDRYPEVWDCSDVKLARSFLEESDWHRFDDDMVVEVVERSGGLGPVNIKHGAVREVQYDPNKGSTHERFRMVHEGGDRGSGKAKGNPYFVYVLKSGKKDGDGAWDGHYLLHGTKMSPTRGMIN